MNHMIHQQDMKYGIFPLKNKNDLIYCIEKHFLKAEINLEWNVYIWRLLGNLSVKMRHN